MSKSTTGMVKTMTNKKKVPVAGRKRSFKCVGFASRDSIIVQPAMTEEERASSWYSSQEFSVIGKDVKSTVKALRKRRTDRPFCARGLEKYINMQFHEEKKRREKAHYRTIFMEQERQRIEGSRNPKILRMLSTVNSQWAVQNAVALARKDEREASCLTNDPEITHLSLTKVAPRPQSSGQATNEYGSDSDSDDIRLSPPPTIAEAVLPSIFDHVQIPRT